MATFTGQRGSINLGGWGDALSSVIGGGYQITAAAARRGVTAEGLYKAFGAPDPKYGNIKGYNPNLMQTNTAMAKSLGMQTDNKGTTGTGVAQPAIGVMGGGSPSYAPAKPATTTPSYAVQSVTGMAKPATAPASLAAVGLMAQSPAQPAAQAPTPAAPAATSPANYAENAKMGGVIYKGNPTAAAAYDGVYASLAHLDPVTRTETARAHADKVAAQYPGVTSSYGNASQQPAGANTSALPTATAIPSMTMGATWTDPGTGRTMYSDGKGRWLTSGEYGAMLASNGNPMGVTAQQAAAGGGIVAPPQVVNSLPSNKIISEGGAMGGPIEGPIGAGTGGGTTPATGGGALPVVTPPHAPGTPAAAGPAPGQQGAGQAVAPAQPTPPPGGVMAQPTPQPAPQPAGVPPVAMPSMTGAPAFRNAYDDLGPYDDAYQQRLAGQAVDNAEQQYGVMARRIREDLAGRGFAGDSGMYLGAMNDLARETGAARTRGLNDAMLKTADQRASFGLQRAQGIMGAQRDEFDRWKTAQALPRELAGADLDLGIKSLDLATRTQLVDTVVRDGLNKGLISDLEARAAQQLMAEDSASWPDWLKGLIVAGLTGAGGAVGFMAGGLPGMLGGAQVGGAVGTAATR